MTFPDGAVLQKWDPEVHAPFVGLINPKSGGQKGLPIFEICQRTETYSTNVFHIVEVIKGSKKGGLLDRFRSKLNEAKEHAKGKNHPSFRPRLICGGGDGTASFALLIVFKALLADNSRADEGLKDTGHGFIWTDEEMKSYFPALVQMPLGTGNDLSGVLGWGRKAPGHSKVPCASKARHLANLVAWFDKALRATTPVVNFDVWGFMPPPGENVIDVKMCELQSTKKIEGNQNLLMKTADAVVPFLVLLYASYGFSAYVVAKFQLARHASQLANTLEYGRIGPAIMLGSTPAQLRYKMEGLSVKNLPGNELEKNQTDQYFPPRTTRKASKYGEVGALNVNSYSGGNMYGFDRTTCFNRWLNCRGKAERRQPVSFNDGKIDFFRQRQPATVFKTGTKLQTDKKNGGTFHFEEASGKGIFMQYDGEGRFVFHPEGKAWRMDLMQVLRIPMVVGFPVSGDSADAATGFQFIGEPEDVDRIKARLVKWVNGGLVEELNATDGDIKRAGLPLASEFPPTNQPTAKE